LRGFPLGSPKPGRNLPPKGVAALAAVTSNHGQASSRRGLTGLGVFCRFLALLTALLIFAGALVTSTGSGLAVPDWPLSFGTLFPRMVGGVLFEHGHRMIAGLVLLATLAAALWASRAAAPGPVRLLAWLGLGAVLLQALLGGLTVLMKLPTPVSVAHGCLAQAFFCLTLALAALTSPSWSRPALLLEEAAARRLRLAGLVASGALFGQLVLGATMRHMGAGMAIPDFPTSFGHWAPPVWNSAILVNFCHRVGALAVVVAVLWLAFQTLRQPRRPAFLAACGGGLGLMVLLQAALGAWTVWSWRGPVPASLHVLNGACLLALAVFTSLWAFRLSPRDAAQGLEKGRKASLGLAATFRPSSGDSAHTLARRGPLADWLELAKPRLVLLAGLTAASAFWLGSGARPDWPLLGWTVLGVLVMGAGGAALNHVLEVDVDRLMRRTCNRPLPAGRLPVASAARAGGAAALAGVALLAWKVNLLAGLLAALALVLYDFVYTPLKRRTCLCTLVGAVPGALPVLIGWAGATGRLDAGGWMLFCILFLWQLPHFYGIAWLYREDYQRAGFPMLASLDPEGRLTSGQILLQTLALLPVSLLPTFHGITGPVYFFAAVVLGLFLLVFGLRVARRPCPLHARQLVLATVVYLPLLNLFMVLNRGQ
jgi:protoheme IX farnesyltransferase